MWTAETQESPARQQESRAGSEAFGKGVVAMWVCTPLSTVSVTPTLPQPQPRHRHGHAPPETCPLRLAWRSSLTTGIQFCGEDFGVLHPDLVDASVLGPQVLDLELVMPPEPSHVALALAVEAVADHLAILRPEKREGLRGSVRPRHLLPQSHSGCIQQLSATDLGTGGRIPEWHRGGLG